MSEREPFESFLLELDDLLRRPEQDEDSYQQLLERHQVVFRVLGYAWVIPKPRLISGAAEMIPDFLAQRDDGVWEVVELKRPDTRTVLPKDTRQKFYADCESYLAQCAEYAQHFDDEANRARFRDRYGVEVQKGVPSVLVAGRSDGEPELTAHRLLHYRNGQIRLRTYDSLRASVAAIRTLAFGARDSRSGFSAHLLIRCWQSPGIRNHVLEVLDRGRTTTLAMLIDEEANLCIELTADGDRSILARAPMKDYQAEYGAWQYISIDVATNGECTFISIEVDARRFCDRTVDRLPWTFGEDSRLSAGAPTDPAGRCAFDLAELLVLKDTLSLDERLNMRRYYLNRRGDVGSYIQWRDRQRMETR